MDLKPYRPYLIAGLSAALVAAGGLSRRRRAAVELLREQRREHVAQRDRFIAGLNDPSPMARVVALHGLRRLDLTKPNDDELIADVLRAYLEQPRTETEQRLATATITLLSPPSPSYEYPEAGPELLDDELFGDDEPPWATTRWSDADLELDEPPPLPRRGGPPPDAAE